MRASSVHSLADNTPHPRPLPSPRQSLFIIGGQCGANPSDTGATENPRREADVLGLAGFLHRELSHIFFPQF